MLEELSIGSLSHRHRAYERAQELPVIAGDIETRRITARYLAEKVMPADAGGEAAHLAFTSQHACDYLLTWNCRHPANANKFRHIAVVNERLGLHVPLLITPLELMGICCDMKDEALEEIHAIRQQISEECGRDVDRYFDHLREVSAHLGPKFAKWREIVERRIEEETAARVAEES